MSKQTGGPAFPWCGDLNECPTINLGMSVRDYFAVRAMQAIIGSSRPGGWILGGDGKDTPVVARMSYEMADAMLAERAK